MDHRQFSAELRKIINSEFNYENYQMMWNELKAKYMISKNTPHLNIMYEIINENFDNKNIKILDHGSGGCRTIFHLILNGYKNIYGVDVKRKGEINHIYKKLNLLYKVALNKKEDSEDRLILYDGINLPFKDNFFDFIFSQQVLEHLDDNTFKKYLLEERRVLNFNKIIYHQIPHKLVPIDTHTNSWFIHMFPKKIFIAILILFKRNKEANFVKDKLFLRFPKHIKLSLQNIFGDVKIINYRKIKYFANNGELKGISKFLRFSLSKISNLILIGKLLSKKLSIFTQLEIIAKKN